MNISNYVVHSCLNSEIIVINDLKEITYQLSKIGSNINQITVLAHQEKISVISLEDFKNELHELWEKLDSATRSSKRK